MVATGNESRFKYLDQMACRSSFSFPPYQHYIGTHRENAGQPPRSCKQLVNGEALLVHWTKPQKSTSAWFHKPDIPWKCVELLGSTPELLFAYLSGERSKAIGPTGYWYLPGTRHASVLGWLHTVGKQDLVAGVCNVGPSGFDVLPSFGRRTPIKRNQRQRLPPPQYLSGSSPSYHPDIGAPIRL